MKILHIATYQKGGAAIAAIRLHRALIAQGYDSRFLFLECAETDTFFKFKKRNFLNQLLWKIVKKFEIPLSFAEYRTRKNKGGFESFSFAASPYVKLHEHPLVQESDVINLHWVANFLDYKTFFGNINKPVIWTLHDMQPFQGGFHYKQDEVRNAAILGDLDQQQYSIKLAALTNFSTDLMTVVAPSKWLVGESSISKVLGKFQHRHIPYSIDTEIFKVQNREQYRQQMGLREDKLAVLFVCEMLGNPRKGFEMVLELIRDSDISSRCLFMAVGKVNPDDQISQIRYLGTVNSEQEMSAIYNSADLFIIPSREDNLPNTIIESLCCGTPVIGFSIGGLKESIYDFENGVLSGDISVSGLKNALLAAIARIDSFNRNQISGHAHSRYSAVRQTDAYLAIYDKYHRPETIEIQS